MLTNASITIFNKFPDQKSRKFIYVPHYIGQAWFHKDQKISVASGGMTSADAVKVRILCRSVEIGLMRLLLWT